MLTKEQKILCTMSHLGFFVGMPILAPLIMMLVSEDIYVKSNSKGALLFQLAIIVIEAFCGVIIFSASFFILRENVIWLGIFIISIGVSVLIGLVALISPIIATIKIWNDKEYSYPIVGRLINHF